MHMEFDPSRERFSQRPTCRRGGGKGRLTPRPYLISQSFAYRNERDTRDETKSMVYIHLKYLRSTVDLAGGHTSDTLTPGVAGPVPGRGKENRYLDFLRLSLNAPAKDIKLALLTRS